MDLKLKVCKGSPIRKILSREASSCGASSVIIGTSVMQHTIRSRVSVAKYCAKSLPKNVSVLCVDNGKILFQRESIASVDLEFGSAVASESRFKKRTLSKSPLSLPPQRVLSSISSASQGISMALVPSKTQARPVSKSGWTQLRSVFLRGSKASEDASTKKSSVMQWIFKLPIRQSISDIYPHEKQSSASNWDECCSHLEDRKGATAYSNKILFEELKDLEEKYSKKCQLFSYQELSLATHNFKPGLFPILFFIILLQCTFGGLISYILTYFQNI